jgi:cytochrome c
MKTFLKCLAIFLTATGLLTGTAISKMTPEELAAESEAYCESTASQKPTHPDTIIAKVAQASALLQAQGSAAFPKFKGKGSPFLFEGTYIWVHALKDGVMLVHPIKYKMEGKNLISLKDVKGKRFFVTMNNVVNEKGEGWVEYYWPVPGSDEIVRKVSYVKKCTLPDGSDVVLGCGIYNGDEAAMAKLEIH